MGPDLCKHDAIAVTLHMMNREHIQSLKEVHGEVS